MSVQVVNQDSVLQRAFGIVSETTTHPAVDRLSCSAKKTQLSPAIDLTRPLPKRTQWVRQFTMLGPQPRLVRRFSPGQPTAQWQPGGVPLWRPAARDPSRAASAACSFAANSAAKPNPAMAGVFLGSASQTSLLAAARKNGCHLFLDLSRRDERSGVQALVRSP
jgi:hypothetical protein